MPRVMGCSQSPGVRICHGQRRASSRLDQEAVWRRTRRRGAGPRWGMDCAVHRRGRRALACWPRGWCVSRRWVRRSALGDATVLASQPGRRWLPGAVEATDCPAVARPLRARASRQQQSQHQVRRGPRRGAPPWAALMPATCRALAQDRCPGGAIGRDDLDACTVCVMVSGAIRREPERAESVFTATPAPLTIEAKPPKRLAEFADMAARVTPTSGAKLGLQRGY